MKQEDSIYTKCKKKHKKVLDSHLTKVWVLFMLVPGAFPGYTHISFDFAQQVHVPNVPDPLYFKLGIFSTNNEAAGVQMNHVIPESILMGKGPNAVVSMLHHYLSTYSLGE